MRRLTYRKSSSCWGATEMAVLKEVWESVQNWNAENTEVQFSPELLAKIMRKKDGN